MLRVCSQHRHSGGRVLGKDEIGLQRNEFLRKSLHQLHVVRRPSKVNPCVAPLRPAELLEALAERSDPSLSFMVALRIRHQHPMRRTRSTCCALAASGHTAAAPPSSVMNSRRFIIQCLPYGRPKG